MQNQTLINTAKKILKDLLAECTPEQQLFFKKMYSHKNLELDINLAVDQMDPNKMDHAITQAEYTVEKNRKRLSHLKFTES